MGLTEKLANAKSSDWLTECFSDAEIKSIVELAKISARIEKCRLDMGMTQKQFAEFMNVTQGMVSKWESREYNFTIKSLNEICEKIGYDFSVSIEKKTPAQEYAPVFWINEFSSKNTSVKRERIRLETISSLEAIA